MQCKVFYFFLIHLFLKHSETLPTRLCCNESIWYDFCTKGKELKYASCCLVDQLQSFLQLALLCYLGVTSGFSTPIFFIFCTSSICLHKPCLAVKKFQKMR